MPNEDDYAILIGLNEYQNLKKLNGPINDVTAMRNWLVSTSGGYMPPANICEITSPMFDNTGRPTTVDLTQKLLSFLQLLFTKSNCRRLYIYGSGHGFADALDNNGCLLTADAQEDLLNTNISVSNYLDWFQRSNLFREYVVLLDACMDTIPSAVPSLVPFKVRNMGLPPSPCLLAYAAKPTKKAIEMAFQSPTNATLTYGGVFTRTVLDGLGGAAANAQNVVTAHSLQNWVDNSMHHWFDQVALEDIDVSQEPYIKSANPDFAIVQGVTRPTYDIELQFPQNENVAAISIWSGRPPVATHHNVIGGSLRVNLPIGFHLVESDQGHRQGFEVVRPRTIEISERGNPVNTTGVGRNFRLDISAGTSGNQLTLMDANYDIVSGGGRINRELPFGLYRCRVGTTRRFTNHVFLLDGNLATQPGQVAFGSAPSIASAIPFENSPRTHDKQASLVTELEKAVLPPEKAQIAIITRSWTDVNISIQEPWFGVKVLGAEGRAVKDFQRERNKDDGGDKSQRVVTAVDPAPYFVQFPFGEATAEMALPAVKGWRTEFYFLRSRTSDLNRESIPKRTVIMRRQDQQWTREQNDRLEKALVALTDKRSILNSELAQALLVDFRTPVEGIVGAHLLLMEKARGTDEKATEYWADKWDGPREQQSSKFDLPEGFTFDSVILKLREMVGLDHPDVEALSTKCDNPDLRRQQPFDCPPLLERSWVLMLEAADDNASLLPVKLWKRVKAEVVLPPYLTWSVNAQVRKNYREAIGAAAARTMGYLPEESLSAFSEVEIQHPMSMPLRENVFGKAQQIPVVPALYVEEISPTGVPPTPNTTGYSFNRTKGRLTTEETKVAMTEFSKQYRVPPSVVKSVFRSAKKPYQV